LAQAKILADQTTLESLAKENHELSSELQEARTLQAIDFEDFQGQIKDWERVGKALLNDPYNKETYQTSPNRCREHAENLVKALKASILINEGNMAPNPPSGMMPHPITEEQASFLWKQIPDDYKQSKRVIPKTSEELVDALQQLLCRHPHEAAIALGDQSGEQEWEASLEQMEELAQAPSSQATTTNTRSTLFKAADIPKFTTTKEYDDFRSSLLMFLQSTEAPSPHEFGMALLRILSTFEDPVAKQASKGWDIRPLLHHSSWPITYNQFIRALDAKFQSATLLQDTKIEWMKCKPKEGEKAADFFNRFEALTNQLIDVQQRKGAPQLSDTVVAERLLLVLPRYLTDDARQHFGREGRLLELETPTRLRQYFEISWTYLPKPAAVGHNTRNNYQTGNTRNASASPTGNQTKPRSCGLICSYDTAPAVPENLRGSLYPDPRNPANDAANAARRQRCAQQQVCTYCRRTRDQHQPSGPNFKVVQTDTRVRRTPLTELIPEERRLEASSPAA
jgi:hypothetical protein